MLACQPQNTHHTKLPRPGAMGFIRGPNTVDPRRRCIASHYPLTDSPDYRYCIGIHTLWVRFLDNGEVWRFSAIWFEEAYP